MGPHDLTAWRDQWGIAHLLPNAGDFLQHLLHLVQGVLLSQLGCQIRQHAAWDLGHEDLSIDPCEIALELVILPPDRSEVVGDRCELRQVQTGVVGGASQRCHKRLGRWVRGSAG